MHVTSTSLESSRKEWQQQTEEVNYLKASLHNFQQYTRKINLEFHGDPESSYRRSHPKAKIAAALEVQVIPSDIKILHKLRLKNDNSVIFAKFCGPKVKNIKASDYFRSFASAVGSKDRLFINENLTKHRRLLVDSGNQRQRDGCIRSVWECKS